MSSRLRRGMFRGAGAVLIAVLAAMAAGCAMTFIDSIPALPDDALAPVVAVSSFENRSGFSGQWQLGSGMADILVSELVQSRNFVVVERQHFDGVAAELRRQQTPMFRPEGKPASGRMKSAQFLIRGVIDDFSQTGGGGLSVAFRWLIFMGRGYNARVALTLTLVDIESGQIVGSVQSTALVRTREAYAEGEYKGVTFGGDMFFKTPLGQATQRAIHGGVRQIVRDMPRNLWKPMVATVRDAVIVLNGGRDRGFKEGATYEVRMPAEPVTDPATGDVLSVLPGPAVGTIRIVRVEDRISFATALKGSGFARGQWLSPVDSRKIALP